MKSIGDRLGKQEEAKQGNLWDWVKNKMIDKSFTQVGTGDANTDPQCPWHYG